MLNPLMEKFLDCTYEKSISKGKYYTVSSPERASQFGRNPEMFVVAIERLVHQYPCLLKLLNMTEEENRRERGRSKVGKEVCI